ncbi:MAG: hypothetical protein M1828_007426 [Chrysothrix sp. TS-e1954]|nr:MAG: hypothetical protein M1828_007426 [Chrysothrix sp. TS-e1954]
MSSSSHSSRSHVPDYGTTGATGSIDHKSSVDPDVAERYSDSSSESEQAGVKAIEAVARTWTPWSLAIAYIGIFAIAFSTSLEGQTTTNLTAYATSAFSAHSLVSTVGVISGVVLAVIKPPMAKISDVLGRLEAFAFSIFLFIIGYIQMAASNNVKTFASAQIFYSAGSTGVQILQQIFIADTTNLLNRALFSSLPDTPFLVTVWVGPLIAESVRTEASWRWGYGIWAIVLPVAFLPLALSLFLSQRKASKLGILSASPFKGERPWAVTKHLWYYLDFFGLLLLCAAISLILLPLPLAPTARHGWHTGSFIAMMVIGGVCLLVFPFWERNRKLAPKPFFPQALFRNRTVLAGVAIAFFYFMAFYMSVQPYFYSYLLVVQNLSISAAGHVTQVFTFTSTVTAVLIGFVIKYTGHYKYFVTFGACIYLMSIGLMIKYRTQTTSIGALVGCQIALGIGGGMINVPTQLGVQASASHQGVAAATAVFLTILEVGGAVGSAVSGAIWSSNILPKLEAYLPAASKSQAATIYGDVTVASTKYAPGTPERMAIDRAYQETMNILLIVAVCICVPLIPLSLIMKNYKLNSMDQGVRGRVIGGRETTDGGQSEGAPAAPHDTQEVGRSHARWNIWGRRRGL